MTASTDHIRRYYSEDLALRASAGVTTQVVRQVSELQSTFPLATIALGRAITGALLMASQLREGQQIGLNFKGDGPLGQLFAEANYEAEARGYVSNPQADLPLKAGRLDVGGAVGRGTLSVSRSMPFQKQPHVGIVPIHTGEVADDLTHYYFQSHQVPSIIALTVALDGDGSVLAAGGVLLELMPGASEALKATLERRVQEAESLSRRLLAGHSLDDIVAGYVHETKLVAVDHEHPVRYVCKCSQGRVDRTLTLLGRATLSEMVLKGKDVPVTCQFCGRQYVATVAQLREILANIDDDP